MKTLKPQFKQENIDSDNILTNYSHKDKVKVALYCAEDCFHINPIEESKLCIDLIKKWLTDEKSVTKEELRTAADNAANAVATASYAANAAAASYAIFVAASATNAVAVNVTYAAANASYAFGDNRESKLEEYRNYARLFAYEDLDFPYKDFAKTFNLDNPTDLNIFLDFLTDNYPEAITYPREEYFKSKLPREYLKVIYQ